MGCDYAPTEHTHDGICFEKITPVGGVTLSENEISYSCYANISETDCALMLNYYPSAGTSIGHWVSDKTCEDWCTNEIDELINPLFALDTLIYYVPECEIIE